MTKIFNPDWYAARADFERREREAREKNPPEALDEARPGTLPWYIARSQDGDEAAAARALELLAGSTSAAAIQQNGGQIDGDVRAFLLTAAQQALRPAVGKRGNKRNPAVAIRDWWACVEMHELIAASIARGEVLSVRAAALKTHAAEVVSGTGREIDPSNLAKRYEELKPAIEAFLRERAGI